MSGLCVCDLTRDRQDMIGQKNEGISVSVPAVSLVAQFFFFFVQGIYSAELAILRLRVCVCVHMCEYSHCLPLPSLPVRHAGEYGYIDIA